jgi:hypothetical protein
VRYILDTKTLNNLDMTPDLIIQFGPRSILSLVGIIILMIGVWYVDRTWDEKGSAAYARAKAKGGDGNAVVIPEADLDAAFPFPIVFILGWLIFASSYLFSTSGGTALQDLSPVTIAAIFFSLVLAVVASVPMGNAVRYRKKGLKMKLSMMFVLSWVGLTIVSGLATGTGAPSFILGGLGAVCIVASMKLLWKYRKMGDSWEQNGAPNPKPIVYNMGGPLFVFGWFLFWVAMASATGGVVEGGLPIYFNLRTALAMFAGLGMVPLVMMLDYAHDEGGTYVGLGTSGAHFGRFFEGPIPFFTFWILFGLSSFIALDGSFMQPDTRHWLLLATGALQAVIAGGFIQTALYKGNMVLKTRLSMIFVLLFLALAINIGFDGGPARYLALAGAFFAIMGQMTVFKDRKRGDYWMKHGTPNPNPIVYSVGEPLFTTGWILLALAMSLPMV